MQFTPEYNLPCLDSDDYAAYALYMQCLAETLEDKFTQTNNALESVRWTYAGLWRNTFSLTSNGSGSFTGLSSITNIFWNDVNNLPSTGTGAPSNPVRYQFPGMVPGGLYEVGGSVQFSAGVTANSTRRFQMFTYLTTSSGVTSSMIVNDFTEESLSGGEGLRGDSQLTVGPTELTPGSSTFGTPIGFYLDLFENDANAITIPVGGLTFWAVYIGSNTLIGGA